MLYNDASGEEKPPGKQTDQDTVTEANDRWHVVNNWQGTEDQRSRDDRKFAIGDARNAYQWPEGIYQQRTGNESELPTLTINKTRVHNDIIINEMSKHGFGIKVRPTAGKASAKSAQVMMNIIRRIQNKSKYSTQRRRVAEHQVDGGIGYIVLETRFVSPRSRNQEIFLKAPRDPTGVFLDPYIQEPDGSDANFGFEFEKLPRKEFNRKYPKWKDKVGTAPLNTQMAAWLSDKEVIVAKYWRKTQKPDTYIWYKESDDSPEIEGLESEFKEDAGKEIFKALMAQIENGEIEGGTREVFDDKVEWFLIAGDTIIDRGEWAGKYIPICRAVGRETVIDNTLDRKGHTRLMIDPQRMLNYAASCSVEGVAGQVKAQFLAPLRAIDNLPQWKDANIKRYPVLPYNDVDDEAAEGNQKIDPPIPVEAAKPAPGWLQVGQDAERHMMMVSGQYQSTMGQSDQGQTAISGVAIGKRQEQGDTATYHFVERLSDMDRFIGTQLLDLIPKIYDTKRTLEIEDEKGELSWLMIDPDQKEVLRELEDIKQEGEAVKLALNPALGEYECVSDPGPSWATQREEAVDSTKEILTGNKELIGVIGDIFFKFCDFPGAIEIMERLKKEIKATKPYLFDEGPDPAMQAIQEKLNEMLATNTDLMTKLAEEKLKVRGRDERRDIEAFKAETQRIEAIVNALSKVLLTPQQHEQMLHDIDMRAHDHIFTTIEQANEANVQNATAEAE